MAAREIEVLQRTIQALEAANVPVELRPIAFEKVFDLIQRELGGSGTLPAEHGHTPGSGGDGNELGTPLAKIAARLKLEESLVAEVYSLDGDTLSVHVPPSRIADSKVAATGEIALLIAAGRQAAGFDEYTAIVHIRQSCDEYGKYDKSNFAKHITDLQDEFQIRGKGAKRELKLRNPSWDRATELVKRLVAPASAVD